MYIVDLFKRLFRKSNLPVLLYLTLNVLIIGIAVWLLVTYPIGSAMGMPLWEAGAMPLWLAFGIGIALYAASLAIALSPAGEWILRQQTGCKQIKRVEQKEFLEPLFKEVMEQAKKVYPTLPDDVQIFISADKSPNAFATGRKTICITEGMLSLPKEQIMAALAHECGHLANYDTDLILLVAVGNLVISGLIAGANILFSVYQLCLSVMSSILGVGSVMGRGVGLVTGIFKVVISVANVIYNIICTYVLSAASRLWTKLGVTLVMNSCMEREFDADASAFNMGYGNELCQLLDQDVCTEEPQGLFANLANSHPDKHERIARLQEMGVTYRAVYGSAEW